MNWAVFLIVGGTPFTLIGLILCLLNLMEDEMRIISILILVFGTLFLACGFGLVYDPYQ